MESEGKKVSNDSAPPNSDVIVLDDDEQPDVIDLVGQIAVGDRKCINYLCRSGVELFTPPVFCMSFYRVRNDSNKNQKVCKDCYDLAVQYYDETCTALSNGGNIMQIDYPILNETLAIDDSDSDNEGEKEEEVMLDPDTVEMLHREFDEVLTECMHNYNFEEKVDESIRCLQQEYEANNDSYLEVKTMFNSIRKEVDTTMLNLFDMLRVENTSLPELIISDIDANSTMITQETASTSKTGQTAITKLVETPEIIRVEPPKDLPGRGPIVKPPIRLGQFYFAKRRETNSSWMKVKLENIFSPGHRENNTEYTLFQVYRETVQKTIAMRLVTEREMAFAKPMNVLLEVGARVIALFKEYGVMRMPKRDSYYPGVIGESPTLYNRFRYLVFFDDGYAHYVEHTQVFLICESSKDVWEDVGNDSKAFIKKYITEYPNRSMVKLLKNQNVRTEFRGKWYVTTVMNVDCSLVQLYFDSLNRMEWIYRGSRRLDTMFKEEQNASTRLQNRRVPRAAITAPNARAPYVQYTRDDPDVIFVSEQKGPQRSVAKKSTRTPTAIPVPTQPIAPVARAFLPDGPPGKIVYYTPRKQNPTSKILTPHNCNESCQREMPTTLHRLKGYGPLAKPLLCGFYRLLYKVKSKKPFVLYKAPCGRCLRNIEEMHMYLQVTKSQLTVDLFNFDFWVRCLAEFILEPNAPILKDLSNGVEEIQIPVVNYVDSELNDFVNYSSQRTPMEGVNLNLDEEFLVGCDCEDDCVDKSKCSCWQFTLQGAKYLNKEIDEIGYHYRRLHEPIFTGIYECNSRCKCAKTCLNRVVQNPLAHKLQVFKTPNRGWGIRCINDIPQGAFVCIYAGALLTDQMANEGGKNDGDEYLAELDYIETVENSKEDYEEEAYQSEEENSKESNHEDEEEEDDETEPRLKSRYKEMTDNDFVAVVEVLKSDSNNIRTRLRKRAKNVDKKDMPNKKLAVSKKGADDDTVMISDDEDVREPSSFNPTADDDNLERPSKYRSVREMFGKDENVYIMDAKNTGNIGRYLNHSCSPNIFVQNVFVDTHDLRFPWVSFFASHYIRAGTELTWNYNYDIGSVQDKILICRCGAVECKGRLL